jgi:hypothetical protein
LIHQNKLPDPFQKFPFDALFGIAIRPIIPGEQSSLAAVLIEVPCLLFGGGTLIFS